MSTPVPKPVGESRAAVLEAAVADGILARLHTIVPVGLERILEEQAAYRRLPPPDLDDVTKLLNENFQMVAHAIRGSRVSHERLEFVTGHVRARVRWEIPLDGVMRAYRTGFNVFWEECTAEVASLGLPRDIAVGLARKMSEAMDTLTTHAAAAYVREESHLRAVGEKAGRDLLDGLLRGGDGVNTAEPHWAAPGLDPQSDLVVVVGRISCDDSVLSGLLDTAAAAFSDALSTGRVSPLVVIRGRAVVAVVLAGERREQFARLTAACDALVQMPGVSVYCGLSSPCPGFGGVAAAYEQASLAVSRASDERPVVSLAELPALQHLLTGTTGATRALLAEKARTITELRPSSRESVKQTLVGYASANMNVTRAAADLHVHENTLRYRLKRIRERTGHDPRTFAGLLELMCLVEISDAADGESPSQTGRRVAGG